MHDLAEAMRVLSEALQHQSVRKSRRELERKTARKLRAAWRRQKLSVLRAFAKAQKGGDPVREQELSSGGQTRGHVREAAAPDFDWLDAVLSKTLTLISSPISEALQAGLILGALTVIRDVSLAAGESFSLRNPRAVEFLRQAENRSGSINSETFRRIRNTLTEGVDKGESYTALAKRIRETFDGFSAKSGLKHIRDRAELIAVTEIGDAYSAGTEAMARRLNDRGIAMEKSWLTAGDGRVDPECAGNAGQGWIRLDAAFQSGHARPLAHPGCRCALLTRAVELRRAA